MSATVDYSVAITVAHQDATSRKYTMSKVKDTELVNVKDRVKAINANTPSAFQQTFVSNSGAQATLISKAQIIATQEEVIYNG